MLQRPSMFDSPKEQGQSAVQIDGQVPHYLRGVQTGNGLPAAMDTSLGYPFAPFSTTCELPPFPSSGVNGHHCHRRLPPPHCVHRKSKIRKLSGKNLSFRGGVLRCGWKCFQIENAFYGRQLCCFFLTKINTPVFYIHILNISTKDFMLVCFLKKYSIFFFSQRFPCNIDCDILIFFSFQREFVC